MRGLLRVPLRHGLRRGWLSSQSGKIDAFRLTAEAAQSDDARDLLFFGRKPQTSVNLQALMETGQGNRLERFESISGEHDQGNHKMSKDAQLRVLIQIACFLHRELPVRLAHRALELENTEDFLNNQQMQSVCTWYKQSFAALRRCSAPIDSEKEEEFAKCVQDIYERHANTLITMALGAHHLRKKLGKNISDFSEIRDIQQRLDEFYMSRIGVRMLIGQYLALREQREFGDGDDDSMIGMISADASPNEIALHAIEDAAYMCRRQHGDAPEVTIHGRTDLTFPYVPSHLQYIILELLKNSMRATVDTHGIDDMPPIRIIIADADDNEDVVIKISDEGGGIKRSDIHKIWSYLFTTADPEILESVLTESLDGAGAADHSTTSPLAGLGYGIPISRNYARYFGGDLVIMSMEGYGTDSFIYLPKLSGKKDV